MAKFSTPPTGTHVPCTLLAFEATSLKVQEGMPKPLRTEAWEQQSSASLLRLCAAFRYSKGRVIDSLAMLASQLPLRDRPCRTGITRCP